MGSIPVISSLYLKWSPYVLCHVLMHRHIIIMTIYLYIYLCHICLSLCMCMLFQVSYLESYVDSVVMKWKTVADKVLDAAKMANVPLLSAQVGNNIDTFCGFIYLLDKHILFRYKAHRQRLLICSPNLL